MTIISASSDDIWIHRSENEIWWTKTTNAPAVLDQAPREVPYQNLKVFECHKPCLAWSNTNARGARLDWETLHPKARDFLATESTLQKLSEDYANYAVALVNGDALSEWHERSTWKEIQAASKKPRARSFDRIEKAAYEMAETAWMTAERADGRIIEKKIKVKNFAFSTKDALFKHILDLLRDQENRCAISGLPFQFKDCCDDKQMLPSLDRIDSDGHYAAGNLQIVCRFINFWKNNQNNDEFRRLIRIVQSSA